jgi:acetyl esterase/lipase
VKRRTLIGSAVASAAVLLLPERRATAAPSVIPLWDGAPPGGGIQGAPVWSKKGAVSHIATPTLEVLAPVRPNGSAAVIAAGGGYKRIEMAAEAYPAARWLAARGVTAFVLAYRLPGEGWNAGALAPLQDAQRAIRIVRARAPLYGVDPARVAALGFSAGAHLMAMAAVRSGFAAYPPRDRVDTEAASVAAAGLIYPVITLQPPYDHTSTRRMLIGRHPDADAGRAWSVDTSIDAHTPPLFAVQAADDPVADPANLDILAHAAERAGVSIETHRLATGGHGFGMGAPGTGSAAWPGWFETWLRRRGLLS